MSNFYGFGGSFMRSGMARFRPTGNGPIQVRGVAEAIGRELSLPKTAILKGEIK